MHTPPARVTARGVDASVLVFPSSHARSPSYPLVCRVCGCVPGGSSSVADADGMGCTRCVTALSVLNKHKDKLGRAESARKEKAQQNQFPGKVYKVRWRCPINRQQTRNATANGRRAMTCNERAMTLQLHTVQSDCCPNYVLQHTTRAHVAHSGRDARCVRSVRSNPAAARATHRPLQCRRDCPLAFRTEPYPSHTLMHALVCAWLY